jgi:excisionase family DNA binding protein
MSFQSSYTVSELAQLFGWSRPRVRRWIKESSMQTVKVGKRKVAVPISEFTGGDFALLHSAVQAAKTSK